MPSRRRLRLDITRTAALAIIALALGACAQGTATPTGPPGAVRVVATTTVLADMVRQVGGERVVVESLVPPGGEVHTFDPTPADLTRVADADLIVMNGLGLDEWLGRLATDSGSTAAIVEVAEDLTGVDYLEGDEHDEDEHQDEDDHDQAVNPHLWLNARYASLYAQRIGEALADADPDHTADHTAGAEAYAQRLTELDGWIRDQLAAIPENDRRIVSFHEAFPYFADAYGLEIVGTVVEAPGQDPSAGEIAELVQAIRASGAKAMFSESQFSPRLAETVAREAGITVESDLHSDSLAEPPADTYEGMMRWNVERVIQALGG